MQEICVFGLFASTRDRFSAFKMSTKSTRINVETNDAQKRLYAARWELTTPQEQLLANPQATIPKALVRL